MLRDALHEVGAARSIVIDEENVILAGNGVVEAAAEAGIERVQVVEADGETIIAVRRRNLTPAQKTRLALFDNRVAELADWDAAVLADLNDDDLLDGLFTDDELDLILAANEPPTPGLTDPDAVPEPPDEPITKPGDLWQMGRHRLLCGDAQSSADRHMVLDGETPSALIFDPPWDADEPLPPGDWRSILAFTDGKNAADVIALLGGPAWVFVWDGVAAWYTPNRPLKRMKLCFWYGDITTYNANGAHYGQADDEREARIVSNPRGSYLYHPDPRGKHLSDLYKQPLAFLHNELGHSQAKPVDWMRCLIGNCTSGEVYDPYAGSGTSLIACEQLGRSCLAMEQEPAYCDLIVTRWEEFSGQTATRQATRRAA